MTSIKNIKSKQQQKSNHDNKNWIKKLENQPFSVSQLHNFIENVNN